jgi:hypothetical protein
VNAPGLGGRFHDPDTLSSYRLPRARGPGTFRVPEPAPLRVRSRRGYRVRFEPRGISVKRGVRGPRTMVARAPRRCVRHARAPSVSFELGRAYPKVGSCELPRASRPVMRPIDVCTPKPFQIEHSYFVASQRDDPSRKKPFSTIPRVIHVPKPCGSVLVLAVVLFREARRSSEDARRVHQEARGRLTRTRPGRARVSRAVLPLRRPAGACLEALSSSARDPCPIASGIPVASSFSIAGLRVSARAER